MTFSEIATTKSWPIHSAGPDAPSFPLDQPLLRLIPGSPRFQQSPLIWLLPDLSSDQTSCCFSLTACLGPSKCSKPSTIILPSSAEQIYPDTRFDFLLHSSPDPSDHISFSMSSDSNKYLGLLLLSEIPHDAGIIHCTLYDVNAIDSVPAVRLRLTYSNISPHQLSLAASADQQKQQDTFVPKYTGHRGMGSSGPKAPWRVLENSLESFLMTAYGDEENPKSVAAIELDVQPSKDGRAVIYHNWLFHLKHSHSNLVCDSDPPGIPIHSLTFSQFDALLRKSYGNTMNIDNGDERTRLKRERVRTIAKEHGFDPDLFQVKARTLGDVCEKLPTDIGILVELKYPAPDVKDSLGLPYPTRDDFVNLVLDDLFERESNSNRQIAFLCFEPDICDMLRAKQRKYAVYLSHCEAIDKPCDEFDPRTISLKNGLEYVRAYDLQGIMMLNKLVRARKDVIEEMVKQNLPILTYGSSNSEWKVVKGQFDRGVNGVIADDVHDLVRECKIRDIVK